MARQVFARIALIVAAALCLASASAAPAGAGTPYTAYAVCPLNGARVSYTGAHSYSIFGRETDGKPYGSWDFPLEMARCPGSGLPIYQEKFTSDEAKALKALVATPGYQAIKGETTYFVLAYVFQAQGRPISMQMDALLAASFEVRDDPPVYARYAKVFVERGALRLAELTPAQGDWWMLQLITINIVRQTRDFASAQARLDSLPDTATPRFKLYLQQTRELIAAKDSAPHQRVKYLGEVKPSG